MQFLYRDVGHHIFMDNTTYDQLYVDTDRLGNVANYLKEGDSAILQMY